MKFLLLALPALALLGGCQHWSPPDDDPNADEMARAECRLGGAHTPAGPGDWVCETDNDTYRQTSNPVYPSPD